MHDLGSTLVLVLDGWDQALVLNAFDLVPKLAWDFWSTEQSIERLWKFQGIEHVLVLLLIVLNSLLLVVDAVASPFVHIFHLIQYEGWKKLFKLRFKHRITV